MNKIVVRTESIDRDNGTRVEFTARVVYPDGANHEDIQAKIAEIVGRVL